MLAQAAYPGDLRGVPPEFLRLKAVYENVFGNFYKISAYKPLLWRGTISTTDKKYKNQNVLVDFSPTKM